MRIIRDMHFVYGLLLWKCSRCIKGISASTSGSNTALPTVASQSERNRLSHDARTCWPWKTQCAGWGWCVGCRHDNPSTSKRHIFSAKGRLLRVQYGILCLTISCNHFRYNQCKVCSGEQTFPPTVLSMSAMWTPFNFCAVERHEGKRLWHGSSNLRRSN
jgi:hypothetical protein